MHFYEIKPYLKLINKINEEIDTPWRLPTLEEAMSLMEPNPNVRDGMFFHNYFNNKQDRIWTCDTDAVSLLPWMVNYRYARARVSLADEQNYVRAVKFLKK